MGIVTQLVAGLAVAGVLVALSRWWLPRIILLAKGRGYRGPLFEAGPWVSMVVGLLSGWEVARAVEFDSALSVGAVVVVGMVTATAAAWAAVSVLPRRSGRVPGVRWTWFPYSTAALVLGGAAIVVPVAVPVLGRDSVEASWSFGLLSGLALVCAQASSRLRAPQVGRPDHLDAGGTSVVLLRGFYDDRATFTASDRRRSRRGPRRWIGNVLPEREDFLTAEAYLGPALRASVGPLVGLGDPSDHLPPGHHMLRFYAADTEWRDIMADLLPRAQAVVILVGATQSLTFELLLVRALQIQTRVFLVFPPRQPDAVRVRLRGRRVDPLAWAALSRFFGVLGYALPDDDPGPGTVLGFNRACQGVALVSGAETADSYATAIAVGLDAAGPPGVPSSSTDALLERLSAENAAIKHILDTVPDVARKQRLAMAVINRAAVVDELTRITGRYLDDLRRFLSDPDRHTAVPTIRQDLQRDVNGDDAELIDADEIRILVAAWLTGVRPTAPARSGARDLRPRSRSRAARQFIGGVFRHRAAPGRTRGRSAGRRGSPPAGSSDTTRPVP